MIWKSIQTMIKLNVKKLREDFFISMCHSISYGDFKQSIENNNILLRRLKLLILSTLIITLTNIF